MRLYKRLLRKWRTQPFQRYGTTLGTAFLIALFLRVIHVSILSYSPVADMEVYLRAAQIFGAESSQMPPVGPQTSPTPTLIFPPGYAFFLVSVSWLAGGLETLKPILALQALLDSLAVLALAGATRRIYGAWAAVLAAFGYALYRIAIANTGVVLTETMTSVTFIGTLFFLCAFCRKPTYFRSFLCAIMFTACVYLRSNMLPILGVLVVYGAWGVLRFRRTRPISIPAVIARLSLLGLVPALLLLPWSVRNTRIVGKPTFIATNMGMNLAMGNNPNATGTYMDLKRLPPEDYERLQPGLTDRDLQEYAKEFIREHPDYELFHLIPKRLAALFTEDQKFWPWETHGGQGNYFEAPFGPRVYIPLLPYGPVLAFGIAGMLFIGRRPFTLLVPLTYLAFLAPLLIFFGSLRFRSVGDPLLIVAAAALLSSLRHRVWPPPLLLKRGGLAWVLVSFTCTLILAIRFGSPNLLTHRGLASSNENLTQAVENKLEVRAPDATRSQPLEIPLGSLRISPGYASHLLFRFNYETEPLATLGRGDTFDLKIAYKDANGNPLPAPPYQERVLSGGVDLNRFQATGGTYSRAVPMPVLAREAHLFLTTNYPSRVVLNNFGVYGPIWMKSD